MSGRRGVAARFLPTQGGGVAGLFWRTARSGESAAWFAMLSAALGLAATPLDLLLARRERRLLEAAPAADPPLVLVAGPPRSGTSLVALTLIQHLDVAYVNNLTAVFPRAPLAANRLLRVARRPRPGYRTYYGRTTGLAGVNDGLHLWDRWLGPDRTRVPVEIEPRGATAMRRFFAALHAETGRPLVNKNNRLDSCAALVGAHLPLARFVCLERDPVLLAQSLLRARQEITGDPRAPYGVDTDAAGPVLDDPVEDVCRQVHLHREMAREQRERLGARFWICSYERFCAEPWRLVARVGADWLGLAVDEARLRAEIAPFRVSDRVRVAAETFERLRQRLAGLAPQATDAPG